MEPTRYIVRNDHVMEHLTCFLNTLDYDESNPYEVTVKQYVPKRSLEQNALFHVWCDKIAHELGHTPREIKEHLKAELLRPNVIEVRGKVTLAVPSTTELNVGEMSDFMTRVEAYAATDLGVTGLPHPEDR